MKKLQRYGRTGALAGAGLMVLALVVWMGQGHPLLASLLDSGNIPERVSYQGYLADSGGPVDGPRTLTFAIYDASSGGNKLWEETHSNVPVSDGYFAVVLGGNGVPLGASVFGGPSRYLQVTVGTAPDTTTLPRQQFHAVPYALRAYAADTATSAQSAISAATAVSATVAQTATVALNLANGISSGGYEHVVVVAKSGGDYTSVAEALASITDASSSSRYLVWVAPGVYTETNLSEVDGYVHLQGAGENVTEVRSTRSSATPGPAAATVQLNENGRVSNLRITNQATTVGQYAFGVWMAGIGADAEKTVLDNVTVEVTQTGGLAHIAVYMSDAQALIRNSTLRGNGASSFSTALASVNTSTTLFPIVQDSHLFGGQGKEESSCTGAVASGIAVSLVRSAPKIRNSYVCGDFRAIQTAVQGFTEVRNSVLRSGAATDNFLIEITGTAAVQVGGSQVGYLGGPLATGSTANLICVQSYDSGYAEVSATCN